MRFRHKPTEVEASQWFKPGDHPDETPSNSIQLGCTMLVIPGCEGGPQDVHPRDYILTFPDGTHAVMSEVEFLENYAPEPWYHWPHFAHA